MLLLLLSLRFALLGVADRGSPVVGSPWWAPLVWPLATASGLRCPVLRSTEEGLCSLASEPSCRFPPSWWGVHWYIRHCSKLGKGTESGEKKVGFSLRFWW